MKETFLSRARALLRSGDVQHLAARAIGRAHPPKGNPSALEQAHELFADFTGRAPERIDVPAEALTKPFHEGTNPVVAYGNLRAVEYDTIRNDEPITYRHVFRKRSRPLLAASHDGRALYVLGGAYRFTDRGITDE